MFAQGCCANVNGYPLRGGYDAADAVGLSLAFCKKKPHWLMWRPFPPSPFNASALDVSLPYWHPSVKACRTMLEQEPDSRHRERLQRIINEGSQEILSLPMSAFFLGDELCFAFLPSETFAENQLLAGETSSFKHAVVLGYTNRRVGYVATKKDYDLGARGGYEASINYHWPL